MPNPISGFFGLLGRLFQSGSEKVVDPSYALERAYRQQLQALDETRRGRIDDQARRALLANREDLARVSLGRREELNEQLVRTQRERDRLDEERRGLHQQETELGGALQAFRSRKEVLKAQYGATRARLRVGEALTGYSQTVTTVGEDVRRFEERLLMLQARARAMDTIAIGPVAGSMIAPASVERELTNINVSPRVDEHLMRLRDELGLPAESTVATASIEREKAAQPQLEAAS
jgi:phage shock protein A